MEYMNFLNFYSEDILEYFTSKKFSPLTVYFRFRYITYIPLHITSKKYWANRSNAVVERVKVWNTAMYSM
jgi:hypothetical protein